jgi:hypothetical protein
MFICSTLFLYFLIVFGPLRHHIVAKNNRSPICAFSTNSYRALVSVNSRKSKLRIFIVLPHACTCYCCLIQILVLV